MNILFLHGWQSIPGGVKPTFLAQHGHTVVSPKLPDDDFAASLAIAQAEYDKHKPDVIVGSSRGGALAMNLNAGDTPLVLLCPAWKKYGSAKSVKANTTILHSRADDVIPFVDSEELVRNSSLPAWTLVETGNDHRLADPESLEMMLEACERSRLASACGFDLLATFNSGNTLRDNFLSRLFGMIGEEPVRYWGEVESSPYEYLGRPTLFPKSEPGYTVLDFALRRKTDGLCFVAEMKCELAYCNYRYLTLDSTDQVQRHINDQQKQSKKSFACFLEAAKNPGAFNCKVTTRTNRQIQIEPSGAILVWGRFTPQGRESAMTTFGFADVLSVEAILNDLIQMRNKPFRKYLEERLAWCGEMFAALRGTDCEADGSRLGKR